MVSMSPGPTCLPSDMVISRPVHAKPELPLPEGGFASTVTVPSTVNRCRSTVSTV